MAFPHTVFLCIAVILNCKNWFHYFSKIGVMAYRKEPSDPVRQKMAEEHPSNVKKANIVTIVLIVLNLIFLVVLFSFALLNCLSD